MNKTILILLILVSCNVQGQFIKEKSIDVSVGYGLSAPYDDVEINGIGFYAQGEFVLSLAKWVDLRPYAGLILTMDNEADDGLDTPNYKSIANAALIGGKVRLTAPIPWVAPYIEAGIGASIGSFETFTPFTELKKKGVLFHIPFSLGLELGPKRNFDIAFTYYFHNSVEQFAGAAAFGISFPVKSN